MPEIKLVKRYPHIKDEDVTSIFQEGYIKGFENGRKGAVPVEWIKNWLTKQTIPALHTCDYYEAVDMMLCDWEKENETNRR